MFIIDDIISKVLEGVAAGIQIAGSKRNLEAVKETFAQQERNIQQWFSGTETNLDLASDNEQQASDSGVKIIGAVIVGIVLVAVVYAAIKIGRKE